jgi:pyridoxal phosphate enzyme (YggS family)
VARLDGARLRANLEGVFRRIEGACRRAKRDPAAVTLVAVTKTLPGELIPGLAEAGVREIGENRAVEGLARVGGLTGFRRHLIGHLQTNKVRKALEWADVLHSMDRDGLAEALAKAGAKLPVFVQVNVSGEATKGGYAPSALPGALERARKALDVRGLMTMAPAGADARPVFRELRRLAESAGLGGLSMGMSQDFEAAVEEGATHVRVGTALFEGVLV